MSKKAKTPPPDPTAQEAARAKNQARKKALEEGPKAKAKVAVRRGAAWHGAKHAPGKELKRWSDTYKGGAIKPKESVAHMKGQVAAHAQQKSQAVASHQQGAKPVMRGHGRDKWQRDSGGKFS